jgi:hypothetical protein
MASAARCTAPSPVPPAETGRWTQLAAIAATSELPDDWTIADPFTDQTPHFPSASFIGVGTAPFARRTTRALVRSPNDLGSQIFIVRDGDYARWRAHVLSRVDGPQPLLQVTDEGVIETLDGVAVEYLVLRQEAGLLAGEDLTHLVAHTEPPHAFLFVDAGGPTGSFDPEVAKHFVATLSLDGQAAARLAEDDDVEETASAAEERPRGPVRIVPGEVLTADDMERLLEERADLVDRDSPLGEEHDAVEAVRSRIAR